MLMIVLSLCAGVAVAGFVWFAWGFVENVTAFRAQTRTLAQAASAIAEDENAGDKV